MPTTRRDLLRTAMYCALLPGLDGPGSRFAAALSARAAIAERSDGLPAFVDHEGWIIPGEDRDVLQALGRERAIGLAGAPGRRPVEVPLPGADLCPRDGRFVEAP